MARFSTVTSDDSDSDKIEYLEDEIHLAPVPEQEHDADEEESASGSSTSDSDMHEDDLLPRGEQSDDSEEEEEEEEEENDDDTVEVQDGQDENHEDDAARPRMQLEPFVESPSLTIPPSAKTRTDNSIIPWAQQIGVNAQKMHVMQTSLFRMPEEAAALKAVDQPMRSRRLMARPLNRKHSRESDGDAARFESREVRRC
jgi:nuclear pore complex protein Nup98-Nup96